MKILIIDCNIDPLCWGAKDLCQLALSQCPSPPGTTTYIRRAPHADLPRDISSFDRIIVSGSKTGAAEEAPWINQLLDLIRKAIDLRIPYLGVCYGHQMLVRAVGGLGSIRKSAQPEFGWISVELTGNSILTQGVSKRFDTFASHFDETHNLPSDFRILARSEWCDVQACQLSDLPIFGIQFHPEKSLEEGERILLERKKKKDPPLLIRPNQGTILHQTNIGEKLFNNFLK